MKTVAALSLAVLLALAACGTSDVKAESFRKALKERTDLTDAQASCVVHQTYDEFDQDAINDLYTTSDRADLAKGDATKFEKIVKGCVGK